jgi:hypothetical protein
MYKVHLVPYFASHLDATNRLYQVLNDADESAVGGLLHWIGQRERLVDYDMRHGREDKVVRARIASFKLEQLAPVLASKGARPNKTLHLTTAAARFNRVQRFTGRRGR